MHWSKVLYIVVKYYEIDIICLPPFLCSIYNIYRLKNDLILRIYVHLHVHSNLYFIHIYYILFIICLLKVPLIS